MGFFNGKTILQEAIEESEKVRERALKNAQEVLNQALFNVITTLPKEYQTIHEIAQYIGEK